jgi:spermidine synthase
MKLKATVFITGSAIMALEILGARLLAPSYGNGIFVWTSVIGVALMFLSIGYWRGGVLADRNPSFGGLGNIILKGSVFTALAPLFSWSSNIIFPVLGYTVGVVLSALSVLALPSYFLGMVSPYAIRLKMKFVEEAGKVSGNLYAVSTMGSIFGTFTAGFIFLTYFGLIPVIYAIALMLALTTYFVGGRDILYGSVTVFLIILVLAAATPSYTDAVLWTENSTILYEKDNEYNLIIVKQPTDSDRRALLIGNQQQGAINVSNSKTLSRYTEYVKIAWAINPEIDRVLVFGCGAAIIPNIIQSNYGEVEVDVVDIDPHIFEVAEEYFLLDEETMNIHASDARMFLKRNDKEYDLIVMDVFGSTSSPPFHLTTLEMAEEVHAHLSDDGIYVTNIISAVEGPGSDFFRAEYRTQSQVFPQTYAFRKKDNPGDRQNIMVFATKSDKAYSREELLERAALMENRDPDVEVMINLMVGEVEVDDVPILTDEYAPVDHLVIDLF